MAKASKNCRTALALAVLGVCGAPAFSGEFQYVPDNARVIATINVTTGVKTKTFQEFMKMAEAFAPKGDENPVQAWAGKVSKVTLGVGMPVMKPEKGNTTEDVEIMTAIKPLTIDDVKALKKYGRKNQTFKEIKHGSVTIHQESYRVQFGKDKESEPFDGDAFYLAEGGKYIVSTRQVETLKKIIDRNTPAKLSATLQTSLKDAGANVVTLAVDLKNLPAHERAEMHKGFALFVPGYDELKADVDKAQALTIKVNEPNGKFKAMVALTCGDKKGADAIKKAGDKALADLIAKANEEPKFPLPADAQKFVAGARTALKAIQLSASGATVTASLETDPQTAVYAMSGWMFVAGGVKGPDVKKDPDKSPNR